MLLQNSTGTPATAELTGAAPAVISQNIILKRQRFLFVCLFFNNLVLSRTPGGVISKVVVRGKRKRVQTLKKSALFFQGKNSHVRVYISYFPFDSSGVNRKQNPLPKSLIFGE